MIKKIWMVIGILSIACLPAISQKKKKTMPVVVAPPSYEILKTQAAQGIQSSYNAYKDIALQIWNYAELGYKETQSTALLQAILKNEGFAVQAGIADIPTAFVATYGSGSPVIAILAEYDALPGLAQRAVPEKSAIEGQAGGPGCGHHLF